MNINRLHKSCFIPRYIFANITSVCKKDEANDKENYRPRTALPLF